MVVMTLMQHECLRKSTRTSNVGKQKLKCTQAPAQSSEFLRHPHFRQRSCDPAASLAAFFFTAAACSSDAFLAAEAEEAAEEETKETQKKKQKKKIK